MKYFATLACVVGNRQVNRDRFIFSQKNKSVRIYWERVDD
jgi:hypothetical protein